jgi:hypothetical protein
MDEIVLKLQLRERQEERPEFGLKTDGVSGCRAVVDEVTSRERWGSEGV